MTKIIHTITEEDYHNRLHGPLSQKIGFMNCMNMMGIIQKNDIGKRVYKTFADDGETIIYQIESNEQRDKRLAKTKE